MFGTKLTPSEINSVHDLDLFSVSRTQMHISNMSTLKIAELIWRLRPLAEKVVDAELGRAMEIAASRFLADTLEAIMVDMPKE